MKINHLPTFSLTKRLSYYCGVMPLVDSATRNEWGSRCVTPLMQYINHSQIN